MKFTSKICIIITVLLLAACIRSEKNIPCNIPAWFLEASKTNGQITGIGQAERVEKADAIAKADIAGQINSWVESETDTYMEKNGNTSTKAFRHTISIISGQRLKNARRINNYRCNGSYYVQWLADLRPAWDIIAEQLEENYKNNSLKFTGTSALLNSLLLKNIKQRITNNGEPLVIPVELSRSSGTWYIHAGRISLPVLNTEQIFDFSDWDSGKIDFNICDKSKKRIPPRLKSGQEFIFSASCPLNGFLSIFNIYPDGRVAIIKGNHPVKANSAILFPDPDKDGIILQAGTIDPKFPSIDSYIAIATPDRQKLLQFSQLSNPGVFVSGETSFSAVAFSDWFDRLKNRETAVLKTRTEP